MNLFAETDSLENNMISTHSPPGDLNDTLDK